MSASIYRSTLKCFSPLYSRTTGHTLKKVDIQTIRIPSHNAPFFRSFNVGRNDNFSRFTGYTHRLLHEHIPKHYQYYRHQSNLFLKKGSGAVQQQQMRAMSTNVTKGRRKILRQTNIKRKIGRKAIPTIKPDEMTTGVSKLSAWEKWLAPRTMPPRKTFNWYLEMALVCTVFAITGTSTMVIVRPAVSNVLGLKGSMKEGPWSYRICSLVIMTPLYAVMLVCVGTTFGRHAYFKHFAVKMFSRFGVPPAMMDKAFHQTAKNFRKY